MGPHRRAAGPPVRGGAGGHPGGAGRGRVRIHGLRRVLRNDDDQTRVDCPSNPPSSIPFCMNKITPIKYCEVQHKKKKKKKKKTPKKNLKNQKKKKKKKKKKS